MEIRLKKALLINCINLSIKLFYVLHYSIVKYPLMIKIQNLIMIYNNFCKKKSKSYFKLTL